MDTQMAHEVDESSLMALFGEELAEIIEEKEPVEAHLLDERVIEEAVSEIEANEIAEEIEATTKAKKEKKAKAPKAAKPPKEPKAPKVAKEPAKPRVTGDKKSERILSTLGAQANSFLVLTVEDAATADDAYRAELLHKIDKMPIKVGEKAWQLFDWMGGRQDKLNNVLKTAFMVLKRDGFISTSDTGNLMVALSSYSKGTARSQAQQMYSLMEDLKVVIPGEKTGRTKILHLNPSSVVALFAFGKLGL
jgi:hypothetical protein